MNLALNTLMWHAEPLSNVIGYAKELGVLDLDLGALPGVGHLRLLPVDELEARCTEAQDLRPPGARIVAVTADHHGLSASDEPRRREGVDYTLAAMRAAEMLGAPVVGTSLGNVGEGRPWEEAAERAEESLREAMAAAPGSLRLAIEIHVNDVCNSLEKAEHILTTVAHPRLGVCFDTSLLFHNRIDVGEAFQRLGDRLFHVHLRGATRETYFAIPGRDEVDFAGFFRNLQGIGYAGALSLELYEVRERYGLSTLDGARESLAHLQEMTGATGS